MTSTITTQAPAPAIPQRRVIDDLPLPYQPLEWEEETPFGASSVVYLYRLRDQPDMGWVHIKTEELLLEVKASPERYDLWILFTIPVDEISRSPRAYVAAAQTKLDIINAATGAAIANMRAFARAIGEQS